MHRRRGDIYTAATGSGYGGKPRPVLIMQNNAYGDMPHYIVAFIASRTVNAPSYRISVEPSEKNGLKQLSEIQPDMMMTVRWNQFGVFCGTLEDSLMKAVEQATLELLGLADA